MSRQDPDTCLKERVADPRLLSDAVRRVAAGEMVVDHEIVSQLLRKREHDPLADLTARELEVLGLLAEGRSNQAISDRLDIAGKTVETHVNAIFSKLALEPAARTTAAFWRSSRTSAVGWSATDVTPDCS